MPDQHRQKTIGRAASVSGIGLHSGMPVTVKFLPQEENSGIYFLRTDLPNSFPVPADWRNVCDTRRATSVSAGGVKVRTVEHLLAAAFGLGITNLRVELNAEELPVLDGSGEVYYEILSNCRILEQSEPYPIYKVKQKYEYHDSEKISYITISPCDKFKITYRIHFHDTLQQIHTYEFSYEDFQREIAGARTFCLLSEMDGLLKAGLVSGINRNAGFIVMDDASKLDSLSDLMDLNVREHIYRQADGTVISAEKPRFENEMARHKILDLIGDFALSEKFILGHVEAYRTGHADNIALLKTVFGTS